MVPNPLDFSNYEAPFRVLEMCQEVFSGTLEKCLQYGATRFPSLMNLFLVMDFGFAFERFGLELEPVGVEERLNAIV